MAKREVSIASGREEFSRLVGGVSHGGDPVIITKRGKPVAALVSIADYERTTGKHISLAAFFESFYAEWADDPDSGIDEAYFDELRDTSEAREARPWD